MSNNIQITLGGKFVGQESFKQAISWSDRLKASALGSREGISKLTNASEQLSTQLAGLNGPAGMAAESLLAFAGGGPVALGVGIGVGAIIAVFTKYNQAAEESRKHTLEVNTAMADLQGRGAQFRLDTAINELKRLEVASQSAWHKFWTGSDGKFFGFGENDQQVQESARVRIAQAQAIVNQEIDRAAQAQTNANDALAKAQAERVGKGTEAALQIARRKRQEAEAAFTAFDGRQNAIKLQELAAAQTQARADEIAALTAHNAYVASENDRARTRRVQQKRDEVDRLKKIDEEAQKQLSTLQTKGQGLTALRGIVDSYSPTQLAEVNDTIVKFYAEIRKAESTGNFTLMAQLNSQVNDLVAAKNRLRAAAGAERSGPTVSASDVSGLTKQIQDQMPGVIATVDELGRDKLQSLTNYAQMVGDSFTQMFAVIGSGGNAFNAFAGGLTQAFAQIARTKVAYNIAEGAEALARAFGWISMGNFASAAAAKTASIGHFKAAALWGAVGGVASAASAGISGGGGSGGTGGNRSTDLPDAANAFTQSQEARGTAIIQITGDRYLDTTNPIIVESIVRAINDLEGRRLIGIESTR